MMGTSVLYGSGDIGVAGRGQGSGICLNSKRMFWTPLKYYHTMFLTFVYEDQKVNNGTVFNPSFPVRADLVSPFPMTHCSTSVDVSVRNVCRSNPDEIRIYGR